MDGIRVLTVTGVQTCALPISLSTTRVYGQAVLEIDDTDDSHRRYSPTVILGWDIGGVNTKVACLGDTGALTVRSRPFELQREPDALVRVLRDLAAQVCAGSIVESGFSRMTVCTCAVTMTAELSQMFRTKREGVHFVLDAVSAAFPDATTRVFTTDG